MDAADRATAAEEELLSRRLAAHRSATARPVTVGIHCLGCGDEIPEARRRVLPGCCLCIDCQEDAERAMGR